MCLSQLVLVQPDQFPHPKADARSSGALDILQSARVVSSFDEAVEGCHLVVGTSARSRTLPWPISEPRGLADRIFSDFAGQSVAVVFGREERGLSNEELQRCNLHVQIPANPDYSALNLGMAVQILCYEFHLRALQATNSPSELPGEQGPMGPGWDEPAATVDDVERMIRHLEETLVQVGFHDPENPRQLIARLRRLYQRARLDKMEVNILRGMFKAIQQKVNV